MQIHSNSSTIRTQLCKGIVLAIRQLTRQAKPDEAFTKDLVAFLVVSLRSLAALNEQSVLAWEKRDYWVKADRFRLDWQWAINEPAKLEAVLESKKWEDLIPSIMTITKNLSKIEVSDHHRLGEPWVGCYQKWLQEKNKTKKG